MDRRPSPCGCQYRRFPRRRGDGPGGETVNTATRSFPPQARGWTSVRREGKGRLPVSPAGAGMDLPRPETARGMCRFPRRRGDGPRPCRSARSASGFPPQARGWTCLSHPLHPERHVSPAGAGMDPSERAGIGAGMGFPRRRGDGPDGSHQRRRYPKFPPQARGWTLPALGDECHPLVSPAGAGMDPPPARPGSPDDGFPRRRGDGPRSGSTSSRRRGFPPQARGWTSKRVACPRPGRVSPAGAGMDRMEPGAG